MLHYTTELSHSEGGMGSFLDGKLRNLLDVLSINEWMRLKCTKQLKC